MLALFYVGFCLYVCIVYFASDNVFIKEFYYYYYYYYYYYLQNVQKCTLVSKPSFAQKVFLFMAIYSLLRLISWNMSTPLGVWQSLAAVVLVSVPD